MAEQILKLSPDRDLQCYFLEPTAIAAMSGATPNGFTVSGNWRQQFDWAVVEWNRDNVFEHPTLRYLPDGDLSGLTLTYQETRTNCIPFESNLYPTVDWPNLRIWATDDTGVEQIYYVPLRQYATPIAGAYNNASAVMTLSGTPTVGDRVGICMPMPLTTADGVYPEQHFYYQVVENDTLDTIAGQLAAVITQQSQGFTALSNDSSLTLTWIGTGAQENKTGANGNRVSVYGYVSNGATETWVDSSVTLSGGTFPSTYEISIDFSSLSAYTSSIPAAGQSPVAVPTSNIRKLRWTWAPDLQPQSFAQCEFAVTVEGWSVIGTGRQYFVAGPDSRRVENDDPTVTYSGTWANPPAAGLDVSLWPVQSGNYSGSTIQFTQTIGDSATIVYDETAQHDLYFGARLITAGSKVSVAVDGVSQTFSLHLASEDVMARLSLGTFSAGSHTVVITNLGDPANGNELYFDFLEIAYPTSNLPDFTAQPNLSLATDWDTYHSQSLPAERTAWMINKLGFTGRVNHYTGALWFYNLVLPGHVYNSATVTFTLNSGGSGGYITLGIGPSLQELSMITHLNLPDDTPASAAQAFANLINTGYNAMWAGAQGDQLTLVQRSISPWPNQPDAPPQTFLSVSASAGGMFSATASNSVLSGGVPGTPYDGALDTSLTPITYYWRTDLNATPTLNRAARDWSLAYFTALGGYGMDVVAAFSTELKNADPNVSTGLAQRRTDGTPVIVSTPAVMTNFSPTCVDFWTRVYLDMAALQFTAGLVPYLQSGEVQWWYYPWNVGGQTPVSMPFYDAYTQQQFQATYGTPMAQILSNDVDPNDYPNETAFLPTLIGSCTSAIRSGLRAQYPGCRYEVLYPTDTNNADLGTSGPSFDELINFPANDWTPQNLTCLKTESFTFTGGFNLRQSEASIAVSAEKGFTGSQRSHLIGIGNAQTSWMKEVNIAISQGLESIVLFALDQYCLIGYSAPPFVQNARSRRQD